MRRLLVGSAVMAFLIAAGAVLAQDQDPAKVRLEKSNRHHEWAKIKAGDRIVKTYIVFPEVDRPATAVIVIHENKGLTDWVRSVADQLAEAGYVALAPDLLSGTGPGGGGTDAFKSEDEARKGIYQLSDEQVMKDLDGVVAFAQKMKAANGKVAVSGFCWGGGKAFAYAARNPKIAAAFVFYGSAPKDEALAKVKVAVYGFYGGKDFRITGAVPAVAKKLKAAGKTFEPVTYEGAGHGFMRSGEAKDADPANRKAREQAWQRWKQILKSL